jgi:hypothetical protein
MKQRTLHLDINNIDWSVHFKLSINQWLHSTKRIIDTSSANDWSNDLQDSFKKEFDTFIDDKEFSYMFIYQGENPYMYPTDLIGHICDRYMKYNIDVATKYKDKIERSFFNIN